MKPLRSLALVFLLAGIADPQTLSAKPTHNPLVKTGHAISHAVKAVGHGFMKALKQIQWPTER